MKHSAIVFVLVLAAGALVPAAAQDRESFRTHRFDEDWRSFCDPARRNELLDSVKCLTLAGDTTLSLGGEVRERTEITNNPGFGIKQSDDQVLLHRVLLHGDLRYDDTLRAFVQLAYLDQSLRQQKPAATDINRFDVAQAFLDLTVPALDGSATLRGGRQEITFGSQRLFGVRDGTNIRRDFDGERAFWSDGIYRLDAINLRPVRNLPGDFDDVTNSAEFVSGLYATGPVTSAGPLKADLYYFDYQRRAARFAVGTADEHRHSIGTRLFGKTRAVDWDIEAVSQFGHFGNQSIDAWTIASTLGYRFNSLPFSPRFGIKADIASGNHHAKNGDLGTFNALYPKLPYFSEANQFAPANLKDFHPEVDLSLTPSLTAELSYDMMWRETRTDAIYGAPFTPIALTAGRGGLYTGAQSIAGLTWRVDDRLQCETQFVHFNRGEALRLAQGHNFDFLFASVDFKI